ncbi:MAG: radical SAM protein [Candidatus Diapherotrites archaeon]
MKIILCDPEGVVKGLNNGLAYIVAALAKRGYSSEVLDWNNRPENAEEKLRRLAGADIIGISIKSFTLRGALEIARIARAKNRRALIVAGGPHVTLDAENFLRGNAEFDAAILHEAEDAFPEVADAAKGKGKPKLAAVKGIIFRSRGKLVRTKPRAFRESLDSIPFPDYAGFDSMPQAMHEYPLVTSRGCPYQCTYCSVGKIIGKKFRFRSPQNVVAELEHAKGKYGITSFSILDDDFTLLMDRAKEFCRLLIGKNLALKWSCPNGIRADRLDAELVSLMKKSGCSFVAVGVESADPEVFAAIKKGETLETVRAAISLLQGAGIEVTGYFIVGLPHSTFERDLRSLEFARSAGLDHASWGILVPYPGTEVWDWVGKNGKILRDWKEGFHFGSEPKCVFETSDYSEAERVRAYFMLNMRFGNYLMFFPQRENRAVKAAKALGLVLKYDASRLPFHIAQMARVFGSALVKARG